MQPPLELIEWDRNGTGEVPGSIFLQGPHIDDYEPFAPLQSGQQLLAVYGLETFLRSEIRLDKALDAGQPLGSQGAQSNPELVDGGRGEPVTHASAVASRRQESCLFQYLEVLAGVGAREADLSRELINRAVSICEHIDDLDSTPAGERLSDPRELVEELHLDRAIWHQAAVCQPRGEIVTYSIDWLTMPCVQQRIAANDSGRWTAMIESRRDPMTEADPYLLFGLLGKKVIHPGGRRATEELLSLAALAPGQQVLDIGCGVGTTAIEMATRFGVRVTAADISVDMTDRATANGRRAGVAHQLSVEKADICALPYEDGGFDRVVAEAVTMFVDRERAIAELVRVCRPGGLVLATEFQWRRPPTPEARHAFLGEVCPGMLFDTVDDWLARYGAAGLVDLQVKSGPFDMMTPGGFISDEGFGNAVRVMARAMTSGTARRRMLWLMPRISRAVPYLGYVLICGRRP